MIVSTAVERAPSVPPPPGLDSVRFTVSFGSTMLSLTIGTRTVLMASPPAKVKVVVVSV